MRVSVILALVLAPLSAALLAWQLQAVLRPTWARYRGTYQQGMQLGLQEVFVFVDPRQLWGLALAGAVSVGTVAGLLSGQWMIALLAALLAWRLPGWGLAGARRRRQQRLLAQLPGGLLSLAAALRGGASLAVGLRQLADLAQVPLAQEVGLVLREQRLGVAFDDALCRWEVRAGLPELHLVSAAFRVAGSTGGNLAQTLEGIAQVLQEQLRAQGRLRALTAQGRMQAWVLSAMPAALGVVLYALRPESMAALWRTPAGWVVLALLALLQAAGWWMIRRILAASAP